MRWWGRIRWPGYIPWSVDVTPPISTVASNSLSCMRSACVKKIRLPWQKSIVTVHRHIITHMLHVWNIIYLHLGDFLGHMFVNIPWSIWVDRLAFFAGESVLIVFSFAMDNSSYEYMEAQSGHGPCLKMGSTHKIHQNSKHSKILYIILQDNHTNDPIHGLWSLELS